MLLTGDWAVIGCMQEGEWAELASIDYNQTLQALNERAEASDTPSTTSTVNVTSGSPIPDLVIRLHTRLLMQNQSTNASIEPWLFCLGPGLFRGKLGVRLHSCTIPTKLHLSLSSSQRPVNIQTSPHHLISLPLSPFYKHCEQWRMTVQRLEPLRQWPPALDQTPVSPWTCVKRF